MREYQWPVLRNFHSNLTSCTVETWFLLDRGLNENGCGQNSDTACTSLTYLLHERQIPRTVPNERMDVDIRTDISLDLTQESMVRNCWLA